MRAPIRLFHPVDERLATGAQPRPEDFAWLREQGYQAVVNLNIPSARNYVPNEADIVTGLGMRYVPMPLDCSTLSTAQYTEFEAAMRSLGDARVFVHCAANIKSSAFVHLYRVLEKGHDVRASLEDLESIGVEHEPKWHAYFEQMGTAAPA